MVFAGVAAAAVEPTGGFVCCGDEEDVEVKALISAIVPIAIGRPMIAYVPKELPSSGD